MEVLTLARQNDILVIRSAESGRWLVASGPGFPVFAAGDGFPRPHDGATFFRTDLDAWYVWIEATATWTIVGGGAGAHAASHQDAGADEINVAGLSGLLADDQTPSTHDILTKHGFPGGSTNFLREDGTWNLPASAPAPDQEARVLAYLMGGE